MQIATRLDRKLIVSGQIEGQNLHLTRKFGGLIQHKFLRADLYGTSDDNVRIAVEADADFVADYLSWKR